MLKVQTNPEQWSTRDTTETISTGRIRPAGKQSLGKQNKTKHSITKQKMRKMRGKLKKQEKRKNGTSMGLVHGLLASCPSLIKRRQEWVAGVGVEEVAVGITVATLAVLVE